MTAKLDETSRIVLPQITAKEINDIAPVACS